MLAYFVVLSIALLVHEASAVPSDSHLRLRSFLTARQDEGPTQIPSQCADTCAVTAQALNNCTTNECICNTQVIQSTAACFSCVVSLQPSLSELQQAQEGLQELEDECAQAGDPVPSLTVSVSGAIPSDNPTGGSVLPSIPVATGSQSQSIFFSAPGGVGSPSVAPSASNPDTTAGPASTGAANPDTSVPNASHTTVAAPGSSSSGSVLVTFSSDTNSGVLNPSAAPVSGSASGAASVLARGSQVALTVLIGVMGGFYLVCL